MPKPLPSPEASVSIINKYCKERHDGKLVCVLDPVKGRTLRATRPFAIGDVILQEPPLHAVRLDPDSVVCSNVIALCEKQTFKHPAIWYWCALNSVLVEGDPPIAGLRTITWRQWELLRILFIPQVVEPSPEATRLVEFMGLRGIVDELDMEIMIQVWLHNCFEHQRDPEGYVIYFMPSFCSHSCLPNALWSTDDDSNFLFFPRASIAAGDEVTLTYLAEDDMLRSVSHRRSLLDGAKDFKCMCERCVAPVDFSRGFRCPRCRLGVIYVHADEVGSKHAFDGALLKSLDQWSSGSEESKSAADSTSRTVEGENQRAAFHKLSDATPRPMRADSADDPASQSKTGENPWTSKGLTLYTIWARLLIEQKGSVREDCVGGHESKKPSMSAESDASSGGSSESVGCGASALPASGPFRLKNTCGLISPQLVSGILQIPRSSRCCMCHLSWTESERKRALAAEKIIGATFSRSEGVDTESCMTISKQGVKELLSEWENKEKPFFEEDEAAADKKALKALQDSDVETLLRTLKKEWRLLDRRERLLVDSVIRLTFSFHWYAPRWLRFLESNANPTRKLPHLDRLIWQYRNLYPGLTPALAWAVWSVARALLCVEEDSQVGDCEGFRRYADQCIVSSYKESVFILSSLFGSDSSFTASIVDDFGEAAAKCEGRLMQHVAPEWRLLLQKRVDGKAPGLLQASRISNAWPFYIGFCADLLIATSFGDAHVLGRYASGRSLPVSNINDEVPFLASGVDCRVMLGPA
ncbi:hypothetical protein Efla_005789 [Eimeria flavescens]